MNIRPMGPAPMTAMVSPGCGLVWLRPCTTQASGSVRAACSKRDARGDGEGVLLNDAGRDAHVFRICAVVEEDIGAEVLLVVKAEEAGIAGGGVHRKNAVAESEFCYACAEFGDDPGELVAEDNGRLEHHGVIAAAVDFEVGSAGEGCANAEDNFA